MYDVNNPYEGTIEVTVQFDGNEMLETFENEIVTISRAGALWIRNEKNGFSEFFDLLKHNRELDLGEGRTTFYKIKAGTRDTKAFASWYVSMLGQDEEGRDKVLFHSHDI